MELEVRKIRYPAMKKCNGCGRVRPIIYSIQVPDKTNKNMLGASFDTCKECGESFADAIDLKGFTVETVVKEFTFER